MPNRVFAGDARNSSEVERSLVVPLLQAMHVVKDSFLSAVVEVVRVPDGVDDVQSAQVGTSTVEQIVRFVGGNDWLGVCPVYSMRNEMLFTLDQRVMSLDRGRPLLFKE